MGRAREWGVEYRYKGIYAVLARLGVRPKVPRPTAAEKADPQARERRGERGTPRGARASGLRSGREAWRSEEMRLGLRGQTRKVLAPKGVGAVQPLQLVYEWSYLVLAVSPLTGEEIGWEWI